MVLLGLIGLYSFQKGLFGLIYGEISFSVRGSSPDSHSVYPDSVAPSILFVLLACALFYFAVRRCREK